MHRDAAVDMLTTTVVTVIIIN